MIAIKEKERNKKEISRNWINLKKNTKNKNEEEEQETEPEQNSVLA